MELLNIIKKGINKTFKKKLALEMKTRVSKQTREKGLVIFSPNFPPKTEK
jgi:hypothetical protein